MLVRGSPSTTKMRSFDFLEIFFEVVEDREVTVDDGIHQRVQHVAGAVAELLRLRLAAGPYVVESFLDAAAHRQEVVGAGEDVDFADAQLVTVELDHVEYSEQRVTVLLDLRPLMALLRVFHGQGMQAKLFLHLLQQAGVPLA